MTDNTNTTPASSLSDKERELIAQMPYEEARDKLIQAVQSLETGGLNLDQSMRQWEIGEALAKRARACSMMYAPSSIRLRPIRLLMKPQQERNPIWTDSNINSCNRTVAIRRPYEKGQINVNTDSCIPSPPAERLPRQCPP